VSNQGERSKVLTVAVALVIIVLLVAGGYMAYIMSLPPLWTETLKVKNSTGQYAVITTYRNASDVNSGDLTAFLNTENATLKAAVDNDEAYLPVDYAVELYDDAQRNGINCSFLPLDTVNESPGHAIVAFRTKDAGMAYVDPTGMNVSSDDYPGVPFASIIFLRDQWNHTLSVADDSALPIRVREYRDASPVSYGELLQFLAADSTEQTARSENYSSADAAVRLHDNAEARGLASGIVDIDFTENIDPLFCNAFVTTDKGIVLIDVTGGRSPDQQPLSTSHDNMVYATPGYPLGELPVETVDGNVSYSFYNSTASMINGYLKDVNQYNVDKAAYESDLGDYQVRAAANYQTYVRYTTDRAGLDAEMARYRSDYPNRTTDWPTLVGRSNVLDQTLNSYLSASNLLEGEKQSLDARKADLDRRHDSLASRVENKWLSCYPAGTVKKISVLW
jgi:hypothetical protein